MRHTRPMLSPVLFACLLLGCVGRELLAEPPAVGWQVSAAHAQTLARQTGRPLLVYVGSADCVYCRKLQTTWADPGVRRTLARFIPLYVDASRSPELASQLKARMLPSVLVLTPEGRLLTRQDGYQAPAAMRRFLTDAPRPQPLAAR